MNIIKEEKEARFGAIRRGLTDLLWVIGGQKMVGNHERLVDGIVEQILDDMKQAEVDADDRWFAKKEANRD
jgi:hypothetical protein